MVPAFPFRYIPHGTQQQEDTLCSELLLVFRALASHFLPSFELLRFIFETAIRLNLIELVLLLSLRRDPDMLGAVGHGKGTFRGSGLQESHKDHRSRADRMSESKVLAGLFVPLELGLLHEEGIGAIPTRCFDQFPPSNHTLSDQAHRQPSKGGNCRCWATSVCVKYLKIKCLAQNDAGEPVRGRDSLEGRVHKWSSGLNAEKLSE